MRARVEGSLWCVGGAEGGDSVSDSQLGEATSHASAMTIAKCRCATERGARATVYWQMDSLIDPLSICLRLSHAALRITKVTVSSHTQAQVR
jgi:hypothetical protein